MFIQYICQPIQRMAGLLSLFVIAFSSSHQIWPFQFSLLALTHSWNFLQQNSRAIFQRKLLQVAIWTSCCWHNICFLFLHLMQSDGFSLMVWLPFQFFFLNVIMLPLFRTQSCRTSSVVFPIRSFCFWSTRTAALLKQFEEGDGTELGGWRRWSVIIVALQILQTDWSDTFTAL